jgi:carboxypeptidase C (cathepsin A)
VADDTKAKSNDDADKAKNDAEAAAKPEPPPAHHEEHVVATSHELRIGKAKVAYTATAGRMILREEEGKKQASFFFVAYTRDGVADPATRPIVFAFNGGPGSSSVWLHLGAFGPRRVVLGDDGMPVAPPGRLVDNEHSILDAADLVFVDPVGTGYSRAIPGEEAKQYHHFKRDIETVGEFIRGYLTKHQRWGSPKFLAGESYGTTRAAGVAAHLFRRHGIYFNGLLLISSILNFQTAGFDPDTTTFRRGNDLPYIVFLPTYAAAARYHGRLDRKLHRKGLRKLLDEVEQFAATEYAEALFSGDRLAPERRHEIAARVAAYTGVSEEYVERYDLRIEILRFCKELLRDDGLTIGRIDARYTGRGRFKDGDTMEADPSIDATMGLYASALNDYMRRELEYESEIPYEVLSEQVWQNWDYEDFKNAYVDVSESLREVMARNPFMKVFVANGYYDLATPHFATEYTFSHIGLDPEVRANIEMEYYEAGHMMYVHLASLAKLAGDLRKFVTAAS